MRALKYVLLVIALLVVLVICTIGGMTWSAQKKLDRALKALAATGAPIKSAQLAKAPVPDMENAARVYQNAASVMFLSEDDEKLAGEVRKGVANLSDPAVVAQVKQILSNNAEALRLITEASNMPRCVFPVAWDKGFAALFPHLAKLRASARLLSFQAAVLAQQGRTDEALRACATGFRLVKAADEPILIGELVRYAIIAIMWQQLDNDLKDSAPSSATCRAVARELAKTDLKASYINCLKGERALCLSTFDYIRINPGYLKDIMGLSGNPGPPTGTSGISASLLRAGLTWWLASDELYYLQMMDKTMQRASLPSFEMAKLPPLDYGDANRSWNPHILSTIMMPVFDKAQSKRDYAIATLDLARVALLLKAYRADHRAYPASLAELAKAEKEKLPNDPFSGKPYVYRREKAGFLLYSWGMNLKDDGGTPTPRRQDMNKVGDRVIRCSR